MSSAAKPYRPQELQRLNMQSEAATDDHLLDATDHVVQRLVAHGIPYAIMGGFSLRLRGCPRLTVDVDFAVEANMLQLRTALAGDSR